MSMALLAAAKWEFGIGDPSVSGWLCTAAYFIASFLCWRAAATRRGRHTIWKGIAAVTLLLGINKQLDFHVLLIEIGRKLAQDEGWMDQRRVVLGVFLVGLIVAVSVASALAWKRIARTEPAKQFALAGLTMVGVVVLLRMIPDNPLTGWFAWHLFGVAGGIWHAHVSELFELAGMGMIIVAAGSVIRQREARSTD